MGAGKTIRVIVKEPNRLPEVREIESGLKSMQGLVGGWIERVAMPGDDNADVVLNETGKLDGLPPNFWIPEYEDLAVGTILICGVDHDEGEYISLTNEQVEHAKGYCNENDFFGANSAKLYREILGKALMENDEPEMDKPEMEMD